MKKFLIILGSVLAVVLIGLTVLLCLRNHSLSEDLDIIKSQLEKGDISFLQDYAQLPELSFSEDEKNEFTGEEIVHKILLNTQVSYSIPLFSNDVTLIFIGPDIEKFMIQSLDNEFASEKEILDLLNDYILTGEQKERKVVVHCSYIDGDWKLDFDTMEFLNSMTGGMRSGYSYLYQKAIEEYMSGLEEDK